MIVCRIPTGITSRESQAYRLLWADRWDGMDPEHGLDPPVRVRQMHLDAYPVFRSPLSFDEEMQASAEFHQEALTRLAGAHPIVLLTFDYEWVHDRVPGSAQFDIVPDLAREHWLSWVDPDDDGEDDGADGPVITHAFRSVMTADDPRLTVLMEAAANGASITVTAMDLSWVARPHEGFLRLTSGHPADVEAVVAAHRDIRVRWGTDQPIGPLIDLGAVRDHVDDRRQEWARRGVQVVTGPQYRTVVDGVLDVVHDLPEDRTSVDWLLIGLRSTTRGGSAEATVIAHDTGTCTVQVSFPVEDDDDREDPYGESLREWHQHAGSLDLEGVLATMDRIVAEITPTPEGRFSGPAGSPC